MNPATLQAWAQVLSILVAAGLTSVEQIRKALSTYHEELTEADLNALLASVRADAEERLAKRKQEADGEA